MTTLTMHYLRASAGRMRAHPLVVLNEERQKADSDVARPVSTGGDLNSNIRGFVA